MLKNWSVTYSTTTPESAENGDYAECGFEFALVRVTDAKGL